MKRIFRLGLPSTGMLLLASVCGAAPPAADTAAAPSPAEPRTVYLDNPAAVENLKTEDPQHYGQVKAILAAADALCAPGPASIQQARYSAKCDADFLKTSNPPKKQLSFTLGDTHYIALVVLTHDQPALTPAVVEHKPAQ